jgi:hypothetical protein
MTLLFHKGEKATTFMQDAAKALGLAFVGLCIAARADSTVYVAVISAPILIMGILGVAAHCREIVGRAGRNLARIENRIFDLCAEPLLTLQTRLAVQRSRRSSVPWLVGTACGMLVYCASLWWMINNFFWPILFRDSARHSEAEAWLTVLLVIAIAMPAYPLRKVYKAMAGRRRFDTTGNLTQKLMADDSLFLRDA